MYNFLFNNFKTRRHNKFRSYTTPDSHCHKAERHIQEIDKKVITILESLEYALPTKFIINLKKYVADCINLNSQSTFSPTPGPYAKFHKKSPEFNPDPTKALLPFGAVCMIKHTDGQRASLATKSKLNLLSSSYSTHHPSCLRTYQLHSIQLQTERCYPAKVHHHHQPNIC